MKIGLSVLALIGIAIVAGFIVSTKDIDISVPFDLPDITPNDEPDEKPDITPTDKPNSEELAKHFENEMVTLGVRRVGQPIEGFNAFMLLQAFPGLLEEDFEGVESFEGVYEFTESELLYIRTKDQPVTSAEDTVSEAGYGTLLRNVAHRLGVIVESEEHVEDIVDMLLEGDGVAIACAPEQREIDACIEIYQPVCGLVNVQCITTPCDPVQETFSNSCSACQNELVESYIVGECVSE